MAKKIIGIEIGSNQIKMALCQNKTVLRVETEELPDNYVRGRKIVSMEAMAEFIKETAKKYHFTEKNCAIVLPESIAFSRRITMPAMTVDQLKLNLPFEFHDFINEGKEKYVYDYAVLGMEKDEDEVPVSMDIMAAAALKTNIKDYELMLKKAGFRLMIAAPEIFAYSNIIREYEKVTGVEEKKEYCFIDLGYETTKMHIFNGCGFDVTREIETGCRVFDEIIAAAKNVDTHIAHAYFLQNYENVWDLEAVRDTYDSVAIEIMRAVNFYSFNNPNSQLDSVYFCGGGSLIKPFVTAITEQISLEQKPLSELFGTENDVEEEKMISPSAIGITYA